MGKSKRKATKPKAKPQSMDVDEGTVAETASSEAAAPLSAKEKLRMKMQKKKEIRVQITDLKKTRAKIGKAKDRRMERRAVTNQLKSLKEATSTSADNGKAADDDSDKDGNAVEAGEEMQD